MPRSQGPSPPYPGLITGDPCRSPGSHPGIAEEQREGGSSLLLPGRSPSTAALSLLGGSSCRLQKPVLSLGLKSCDPSPPLLLRGEIISHELWLALLVRSPCRAEPSWINEAVTIERKGHPADSRRRVSLLTNSMTFN